MSTYHPDKWVMLKLTSKEHSVCYKVLASWYGGFAGSDSWKLSSGTKSASIADVGQDGWVDFPQESGSTYTCFLDSYGTSMYTHSILNQWLTQLAEVNDGTTIEVMPADTDFLALSYDSVA